EALQGEARNSTELMRQQQQLAQNLELQRCRAQSGAARIGRLGASGYNRLNHLLGRPQSERTELEIERLTGFPSEYLDALGQRRIDANPRLRERFPEDAKSSGELETIGKRLSEALNAQARIQSEFNSTAGRLIDTIAHMERDQVDLKRKVERLDMA